jgi:hypothetical protein
MHVEDLDLLIERKSLILNPDIAELLAELHKSVGLVLCELLAWLCLINQLLPDDVAGDVEHGKAEAVIAK